MSPPPRKRTRVDRACQTCIASKVRCQDLDYTGCLRCRQRQTDCSLAQDNRTPTPSDQLVSSIANLTARIETLEQNLVSHPTGQSSLAIPTPASSSGTRAVAGNAVDINNYAPDLLEKFTTTARQDRYPDVVGEGFMIREQVDIAFQLFKYRITSLIPLHPYTLASTPTPTHLFLILAILSFVPTLAPPTLPALLDRALIHASCGASSRQTVHALLLLSLSPISRPSLPGPAGDNTSPMCHFSPLILISMAYDMGRNLGFEEQTHASLVRKAEWGEIWYTEKAQDALMWEVIKSRYALLHLQLCRSTINHIPPSQIHNFPTNMSDSFQSTLNHLFFESQLIQLVVPLIRLLPEAEAQGIDSLPEAITLIPACTTLVYQNFSSWKNERNQYSKLHEIESTNLILTLMIRVTSLLQFLPSPINPTLRGQGLAASIPPLMTTLAQTINLINLEDLNPLPYHIITILGIAVSAAQRTLVHRFQDGQGRTIHADEGVPFSEDSVKSAEKKLKDVGFLSAMSSGPGWEQMIRDGEGGFVDGMGSGVGMGMGTGMGMGDIWDIDNWAGFWQSFVPDNGGYGIDPGMSVGLDPGVQGLMDLGGGRM